MINQKDGGLLIEFDFVINWYDEVHKPTPGCFYHMFKGYEHTRHSCYGCYCATQDAKEAVPLLPRAGVRFFRYGGEGIVQLLFLFPWDVENMACGVNHLSENNIPHAPLFVTIFELFGVYSLLLIYVPEVIGSEEVINGKKRCSIICV